MVSNLDFIIIVQLHFVSYIKYIASFWRESPLSTSVYLSSLFELTGLQLHAILSKRCPVFTLNVSCGSKYSLGEYMHASCIS
jgi:hypothetical protein